jgi:hypothetical protein
MNRDSHRIVRMLSTETFAENKSNSAKYFRALAEDIFIIAKFSHRHYTRYQKKQMGKWQEAYEVWHTQPLLRRKVEDSLEWCFQVVDEIIFHCDSTAWLILNDRMHEAVEDRPRFRAAVKELFHEIHDKLFKYRAFVGFFDDKLAATLNLVIRKLTEAQFVANNIMSCTSQH